MQKIKFIYSLQKVFAYILACGSGLYADFNVSLPTSYTLNGVSETQNAHADCTWLQCTFNPEDRRLSSFTLSNSGSTRAALTISLVAPTPSTPPQNSTVVFYINSMTLNPNTGLVVDGFDGVIMDSNSTWRLNNSSFSFVGKNANASTFTAYSNSLIDLNNSQFTYISRSFVSYAKINLSNASAMILQINGASFYSDIVVNSGSNLSIDINGGSGTLLLAGLEDTGMGSYRSSTASIINNGGKISILGNVNNGGITYSTICNSSNCGAGTIINNSGSMIITGKITSENNANTNNISSQIIVNGGTLDAQGGVENKDGAQIVINGGALETPTLQNQAGGTLNFGADSSGNMGQLIGDLTNNGSVIVDTTGAKDGSFTLITGAISGDTNFVLKQNSDFSDSTFDANTGTLIIAPQQDKIDDFRQSLDSQDKSVLSGLEAKIPNIYNTYSKAVLTSAISEAYTQMHAVGFSAIALLDSLRQDRAVMSEYSDFSIQAQGAYLQDSEFGKGSFYGGGFLLNEAFKYGILQLQVGYIQAQSTQELGYYTTRAKSDIWRMKIAGRVLLGDFEIDLSANGAFGSIQNKQEFKDALTSTQNKANISHVGLEGSIGYRFGDGLSFKPFVGVGGGMYAQGGMESVLGFYSEDFKGAHYEALGGVEVRARFYKGSIVASVLVEQPLNKLDSLNFKNAQAGQADILVGLDSVTRYGAKIGGMAQVSEHINLGLEASATSSTIWQNLGIKMHLGWLF
ncbi:MULTISPECIES: hypothetical protein [unclassified Helicobacter]|uniref:hypothetical protein n=1 Tax=unclassified Helicobacter TaxID=2593540 RepID=UPI0011C06B6F|nr:MULTISPECIES: hypothetical protein [unclassified Helicobacter]